MARYTGPRLRLARREGADLMLLSPVRSMDSKCKESNPPGQHGLQRKKPSEYGVQFREKQKVKRMYGLLEKQFYGYYEDAKREKGNTASNLLVLLERRLDNFLYRAGFAATRAEARQMVVHRLVLLNGRITNLPSYLVKPGDVLTLKEKAQKHKRVETASFLFQQLPRPEWIDTDFAKLSAKFVRLPERSELSSDINENLIIELYSK